MTLRRYWRVLRDSIHARAGEQPCRGQPGRGRRAAGHRTRAFAGAAGAHVDRAEQTTNLLSQIHNCYPPILWRDGVGRIQ